MHVRPVKAETDENCALGNYSGAAAGSIVSAND